MKKILITLLFAGFSISFANAENKYGSVQSWD